MAQPSACTILRARYRRVPNSDVRILSDWNVRSSGANEIAPIGKKIEETRQAPGPGCGAMRRGCDAAGCGVAGSVGGGAGAQAAQLTRCDTVGFAEDPDEVRGI